MSTLILLLLILLCLVLVLHVTIKWELVQCVGSTCSNDHWVIGISYQYTKGLPRSMDEPDFKGFRSLYSLSIGIGIYSIYITRWGTVPPEDPEE
jgi:hypothetical protein